MARPTATERHLAAALKDLREKAERLRIQIKDIEAEMARTERAIAALTGDGTNPELPGPTHGGESEKP